MKKVVLTLLAGLLYIAVQAQVTFKPGVKLGSNISKITNLVNDDNRVGVYVSVIGELKLAKFYALQPEISYSQQGSKSTNLDYISISLANKFYFLGEDTPVYVVVGPSYDIKLGGRVRSYNIGSENQIDIESDFSLLGGFGYDFPFGLGIEARYKHGLIDIGAYDTNFYSGIRRLNSVIQIGAIYKFDFSK